MNNRRSFLKKLIGSGAALNTEPFILNIDTAKPVISGVAVDNPYEGVSWKKIKHVSSTSHIHIADQEMLDRIYHEGRVRHLPISNYYPSVPYYPLQTIRENQYMVKQDFGVMYRTPGTEERKLLQQSMDWNQIIMDPETGWYHTLPVEQKKQLPFKEGPYLFKNIPPDLIVSPNAEHHAFIGSNQRLHVNSLGSLYRSGSFDRRSKFKTVEHGYANGTWKKWRDAFNDIIEQLLFPDAGGITINHPTWSKLDIYDIFEMLDYDPRVLGIEVFNDSCAIEFGDPTEGWAVKLWDDILRTGRKCFGFFVPDHSFMRGRNMLLVDHFTEHDCLKAYRKGAFYGSLMGSDLHFTGIRMDNFRLFIETNRPCTLRIITNKGVMLRTEDTDTYIYDIPMQQTPGIPDISFVRIEANDSDTSEQIYSQPIRFLNTLR